MYRLYNIYICMCKSIHVMSLYHMCICRWHQAAEKELEELRKKLAERQERGAPSCLELEVLDKLWFWL